jgi:hypothetical protein
MYVGMHNLRVNLCVCMYVCIYVCMYVCTYVRTYESRLKISLTHLITPSRNFVEMW